MRVAWRREEIFLEGTTVKTNPWEGTPYQMVEAMSGFPKALEGPVLTLGFPCFLPWLNLVLNYLCKCFKSQDTLCHLRQMVHHSPWRLVYHSLWWYFSETTTNNILKIHHKCVTTLTIVDVITFITIAVLDSPIPSVVVLISDKRKDKGTTRR